MSGRSRRRWPAWLLVVAALAGLLYVIALPSDEEQAAAVRLLQDRGYANAVRYTNWLAFTPQVSVDAITGCPVIVTVEDDGVVVYNSQTVGDPIDLARLAAAFRACQN